MARSSASPGLNSLVRGTPPPDSRTPGLISACAPAGCVSSGSHGGACRAIARSASSPNKEVLDCRLDPLSMSLRGSFRFEPGTQPASQPVEPIVPSLVSSEGPFTPEEPLRILLVEDAEADAELMVHALRQAGIACTSQRVQTEVGLRHALQHFAPDLVRSEQRFRKLVEYSSDVATLVDTAGRIMYSSQSLKPTLGYGSGEMTGESVFTLVHPDDRVVAEALFRNALERVEPVARANLRVRHKDGSWRDLEVVAGNHLDDPVVEAIVVNYHDVPDRRR